MILAHRGLHATAPENTLASIRAAADRNLPGVEIDIRSTGDGELVLFHDRIVAGRSVSSLDRKELIDLSGQEVPLLEEALNAFPDLFFDLDVKDAESGRPVLEKVHELGAEERVVVTSFRHDLIAELAPDSPAPLGLILSHRPASLEETFLPFWWSLGSVRTLAIAFGIADEPMIRAARDAGFAVFVWGLLTREDHWAASAYGATALVTDYPEYAE